MPPSSPRFRQCYKVVSFHEGGVADHPEDPGGFTVRGLTLGFLRAFGLDINNDGVIDKRDLVGLSQEQIEVIYRNKIWLPTGCAGMPPGIDLAVFDAAVNLGSPRARRLLQAAVGVTVDGFLGSKSWLAIKNADTATLLDEFTARRGLYYATRPKVLIFGLGWFRRLIDVHHTALGDV